MTQSKVSGWDMPWHVARVTIGRDLRDKPWEALREALAVGDWPDARSVRTAPASSGGALVTIVLRARHAGDAASKAVDFLRRAAPPEWDWKGAMAEAWPYKAGMRQWPLLEVQPESDEDKSAKAAVTVADRVNTWFGGDHETVLELLAQLGLASVAEAQRESALPDSLIQLFLINSC